MSGRGRGLALKEAILKKRQGEQKQAATPTSTREEEEEEGASQQATPKHERVVVSCGSSSSSDCVPLRVVSGRARGRAEVLAARIKQNIQHQQQQIQQVYQEEPIPPEKPVDLAGPKAELELSKLNVSDSPKDPVVRRGSSGSILPCTANYLTLHVDKDMGLFQYEVVFEPQIDSRNERFRMIKQIEKFLGDARVFDGALLYLPKELPDVNTKLNAVNSNTGEDATVTLRLKGQIPPNSQQAIQHMNILFKRIMTPLKMCQMRGNFYSPGDARRVPNHKLEVWPGFVTAVDEYEGGLHLQCDSSHKVLRNETALECMNAIYQSLRARNREAEAEHAFQKALLGSVVLTRYNNKTYVVDDVDINKSPMSTFPDRLGKQITLVEYYKKQHGIDIKDKSQPLLTNRGKKSGSEIWLVPELCYLTGLTDEMRNDFRIMKDVGSVTRLSPNERQQALNKFIDNINSTPEAQQILSNWGLRIQKATVKLEGRHLGYQTLHFGNGYEEKVDDRCDWSRASTTRAPLSSINIDRWILVFDKSDSALAKKFFENYQKQAQRIGIQIACPLRLCLENDRTETYLTEIRKRIEPNLQLVVAIFPQQRADRYDAMKKMCYVESPVPNQVVLRKTISNEKRMVSVVQKICLQINCKLGGELWGCKIPIKNLMLCGADVAHDTLRKDKSVFGFVASLNASFSRWYSATCDQGPRQELMDSLKVKMTTALKRYHSVNDCFPQMIIFFRDGVGDSQMNALSHEIQQLKSAIQSVDKNYAPKFGFLVVQKRINTRIYIEKGGGNFDNPPGGTVIDHTITRRNFYDFFLIPQKVGQGTVTPTHFVVLDDTTDLSPDHMQRITYKMTHMYYNWPGNVRVPAPCQYAHKLAAMSAEHLHKEPSQVMEDKLYYL